MKTITQSLCCVIPSYMLARISHNSETGRCGGDDARVTLEQMRDLANERALSLIHLAQPKQPEARKSRNVCDARGGSVLPGKLILSDHKSTRGHDDPAVREAFQGLGATWDFFRRVYNRDSLDGFGCPLNATVHYGMRFQNAMWNGERIVYGDGDGRCFNRFTTCLDITAHELTHAVVQFTTGMGYSGEAGAVNESLADVFGSMVKQYVLRQTAEEADWLIGAGLLRPCVNGRALRSLAAPGHAYDDPLLGRDPQPSHVRDYVETEEDNGGVHINSGIPNHAFYLAAMAIGGPSWEVAGRIWYRTMVEGLPSEPDFFDLALGTVDMAGELYGYGSTYQWHVANAWARVGIVVPLDDGEIVPVQSLDAMLRPWWRPRSSY